MSLLGKAASISLMVNAFVKMNSMLVGLPVDVLKQCSDAERVRSLTASTTTRPTQCTMITLPLGCYVKILDQNLGDTLITLDLHWKQV